LSEHGSAQPEGCGCRSPGSLFNRNRSSEYYPLIVGRGRLIIEVLQSRVFGDRNEKLLSHEQAFVNDLVFFYLVS
jgi:hypothetical protein